MKQVATPMQVKGELLDDYARTARRNGSTASASDIEGLVVSDLHVADAVGARDKPVPPKAKPDPLQTGKRAEKVAQELGYEIFKKPMRDAPPKRNLASFMSRKPKNPKQAAAIMRLGQILQPASWFRPSQEMDYQIPALAKSFTEAMTRLSNGAGEFTGKTPEECERITWRLIEDLCDKSTARLGAWWVR